MPSTLYVAGTLDEAGRGAAPFVLIARAVADCSAHRRQSAAHPGPPASDAPRVVQHSRDPPLQLVAPVRRLIEADR
jgi:hypothetical protein